MAVFKELEIEHASDTLEEVEPRVQRQIIHAMDKTRAAQLIGAMSPGQAADILSALPSLEADGLLALIDRYSAAKIQRIIDQHDENILLFASRHFMTRPTHATADEVMSNFRVIARDMDVIMYIYVVDAQEKLVGVVDIRELLAAQPEQTLGEIMTDKVIALAVDDTLRDAVKLFDRYGFRAAPVTDGDNLLKAVVSYRDIRGIKPRLE
jgi:Mg/Co/Ni transporter MgtE